MMANLATPDGWLPLAFLAVMGLSILLYVVLDGFDLGIGILMPWANAEEKDQMVAAIGPFWDANETWLVLGIGVLSVAFPAAHGEILRALYLPTALMLTGLILRGVAFDLRVKAALHQRHWWNRAFFSGSLLAALAQGYMLGMMVMGYASDIKAQAFAALIAICVTAAYVLLGAGWLIIKTQAALQAKAVRWAAHGWKGALLGFMAISAATPLLSAEIQARWFALERLPWLAPLPLITGVLFWLIQRRLGQMQRGERRESRTPFTASAGIFALAFAGLVYSLFPWLIPGKLDIWQAAAAPESLMIVFIGTCLVLPVILGYSFFAYRIFRGKAALLDYGIERAPALEAAPAPRQADEH